MPCSVWLPNTSHYGNVISHGRIRWLRSYGVIQHLYHKFNPPGCNLKARERTEGSQSLTLRQLQGAFWMWMVGVVTSILAVLTEMLWAAAITRSRSTSFRSWNNTEQTCRIADKWTVLEMLGLSYTLNSHTSRMTGRCWGLSLILCTELINLFALSLSF